jgi:hypothetical protein
MTLDVYADLFDDDLDAVAVNLDAAIKSAVAQRVYRNSTGFAGRGGVIDGAASHTGCRSVRDYGTTDGRGSNPRPTDYEACDTRVRRLSSRISAGRLVPCRLASSCRASRSSSVKRTRTLPVSFRCSLLLTSSSGTSAGVHATSS